MLNPKPCHLSKIALGCGISNDFPISKAFSISNAPAATTKALAIASKGPASITITSTEVSKGAAGPANGHSKASNAPAVVSNILATVSNGVASITTTPTEVPKGAAVPSNGCMGVSKDPLRRRY